MQRIVVSVSNDLVTDQRVARVCHTLVDSGYEILLIGRHSSKNLALKTPYQTTRLKVPFSRGFLMYAFFNIQLFFRLLFQKKDILLANDLDTLLPNFLVSKLQGKPLVFDSHELFSEIPELVDRPFTKSIWRYLEKIIIPKIRYGYTVSDSIADYYQSKYKVNFLVIRNVPETTKESLTEYSLAIPDKKKVILYQGAINEGRGLELMIEAMFHIEDAVFMLVGEGDIEDELMTKVKELGLDKKVVFLGRLQPAVLRTISPQAAIGVSLEEDLGLNYRYALPNKLFDYIHAGLPVVVSDLPEMKRIVEHYDVGEVLVERTPKVLASLLIQLMEKGKAHYKPSLSRAIQELNWETEQTLLLDLFDRFN